MGDLCRGECRVRGGERLVAYQRTGLCQKTVDRCTGNNTVVIVGKALDLHQSLAPSGGAALEIRAPLRLPVVLLHDRLAHGCHEMNRTVAEVRDTFGIDRPVRIPGVGGGMTAIGLGGGVTFDQVLRRRVHPGARAVECDVTRPSSTAESDEFAIPAPRIR